MPTHPLLVATLLALSPLAVVAQDPAADRVLPLGSWQGTLQAGPQSLELAFHIERREDGFGGTMDSLTQQAKGIPISAIEWDGKAIKITLAQIGGTFTGTLEDGEPQRLRGEWAQGPGRFPLELRAVEEVVVAEFERPQHPEPPFPYRVEEVAYHYLPADGPDPASAGTGPEGTITLAGTLTLPEGEGPFPALLLVTGSGPQDRDESLMGHKPFLVIADHLTRAGFAVLRYDDRGTGLSTGSFAGSTVLDFAADARAGLSFLRQHPRIRTGAIGMVGHSEGGLVAPIVASAHPDEVAFAVLIAAPTVPIDEIILHQQRLIATADGTGPEEVEALDKLTRRLFDAVRAAEGDPSTLDASIAATWSSLSEAMRAEIGDEGALRQQVEGLREPWMRHLLTHDPTGPLAGMRCPTLALFGGRDLQVDPAQNVTPMRKAIEKGGAIQPKIVVLDGHNHLFQRAETGSPSEYQQITETFSPIALDTIREWLKGLDLDR